MACIMLLVSKGGLSYLKYYLPVHFDKEELVRDRASWAEDFHIYKGKKNNRIHELFFMLLYFSVS